MLTGSRSSFVGLLVLGLVLMMRTRRRGPILILSLFLVLALWIALPFSLQERFETILNPSVGPANAQASAQSRIDGLTVGYQLWERFPLTGCGPGAWRPASGRSLESHNLYGQLIGETGTLGLLAFGGILLGLWATFRRIKKAYRLHPEWGHVFLFELAQAVGLTVLLLLFLGNFGHNLFRYSWLWCGAFAIIACHCVETRARFAGNMRRMVNVQPRLLIPGWPYPSFGFRFRVPPVG
jgi:O-antigen ligase